MERTVISLPIDLGLTGEIDGIAREIDRTRAWTLRALLRTAVRELDPDRLSSGTMRRAKDAPGNL